MELKSAVDLIRLPDEKSKKLSEKRWLSLVKPLLSLGKLEKAITQISGIKRKEIFSVKNKVIVIMCADNGVVDEGISQCGREITATVAENFLRGESTVCIMAKTSNADILPIDIGMVVDVENVTDKNRKIAYGTKNIAKEPAMCRKQAIAAIEYGIDIAFEMKKRGYDIIGTGEMGIGNTTTSSAIASVLLGKNVEEVTGRGAGLSKQGLENKINIIKKAVRINNPDKNDPIDVLAKLGGFDIAGLVGIFIGGAAAEIPVVLDGFISSVAALIAKKICEKCVFYMLPSHISKEPAGKMLLDEIGLSPFIICDMSVGEGTGVAAFFPLLDMACNVYLNLNTFDKWKHEEYKILK